MSDTTFIPNQTVIEADWLNEVNDHVHNDTPASPRTSAHNANAIGYTPTGTVSATNVQAAIEEVVADLADGTSASKGSSLVGFLPSGTGAAASTIQTKVRSDLKSIRDFGATSGGSDDSAKAAAMITAHNYLYVPEGFTLVCKNIELFNNTQVICDGTIKLPAACSDFDRLLYAVNRSGIRVYIREIDGNYANQSGAIGTHLVYMTGCSNSNIDIDYAHDHFINAGATMPSVDGIRNSSSGAIYLYNASKCTLNVKLLSGWGREGIFLESCTNCEVSLGHAQGVYTTEYSGLQIRGSKNKVLRASVDFAGASAVGFDTTDGTLSNVIATNTRANSGVNFGHPGFPAARSTAQNIVVDGAYGTGISIASSSTDLLINNFAIENCGQFGVTCSDGTLRAKLSNGVVSYAAKSNLQASVAEVQTSNVRSTDLDQRAIEVTISSGVFVDGETVTGPSGSAVVRKAIRNLGLTSQILFVNSLTGSFSVADAITGGTSGATGTLSRVDTPTQYLEQAGGVYAENVRLFTGTYNQIRFPDGTAIATIPSSIVVSSGGTLTTSTVSYTSNVIWASAPVITGSIIGVSSTNGYTVSQWRVSSTTTQFTIAINASVAQTYSTNLIAVGRWK